MIMLTLTLFCSCEKREPAAQPVPNDVMTKILQDLSADDYTEYIEYTEYISGRKDKELSDKIVQIIYSDDEKNSVDMSKIAEYSIRQSKENPSVEIGIFKLYDKVNAEYVKNMSNNRIAKLREDNQNDIYFLETANNAEVRSYGNYVYYVSHSEKDRIFRIIENMLREDNNNGV